MNRPAGPILLAGNLAGCIVVSLFGVSLIGVWFESHGREPLWLPILGFLICSFALKARVEYLHFKEWKREWAATSGKAPSAAGIAFRRRLLLRCLQLGAWSWSLWWLQAHEGQPGTTGYGVIGMLFLAITFWRLGVALWSVVQAIRRLVWRRRARSERTHVVTVSPAVPTTSPTGKQIVRALPDYCRSLLEAIEGEVISENSTEVDDAEPQRIE